jgi:L-ascorbate metabolism protein UlaG (beta-lactamase superfamily)
MNYMRRFLSILKYFGLTLAAILLLVFIGGFLFTSLSPQFGGSPTEEQVAIYQKSGHYEEGLFFNDTPTSMDMDWATIKTLLRDYIVGVPNLAPENLLPVLKVDSLSIVTRPDTLTRLTWFGHSAFLLEMEGKNILLDPMFGDSPSPVSWLGSHRFTEGLPIEIEQLPTIDAVFFSHDHYDHLDYESVMRLKDKVNDFYVPLGVGAHLAAWEVPDEKIHEMNWWEETSHDNLQIVCTPARHFSGRGITNRFSTLWGSWVIKGPHANIYFSGDSGYGPHFREIGQKYGPFDAALMECGQYDLRWQNIHMLPEETAQAAVDLNSKLMMPIHWGAFVLALHAWKDPVDRVTKKATALGMPITTPKIGERLTVGEPTFPMERWWDSLR